jgi:hypothetical protein
MSGPNAINQFPELTDPPCQRDTKYGPSVCGYCAVARSVAAGMRFIIGDRVLPVNEAVAHNLALCTGRREAEERVVIDGIRRDGQRILRTGANVFVQLKRKAGTRRSKAYVVECYDDNSVKVHLVEIATTKIVAADEFVVGRRGTTAKAVA